MKKLFFALALTFIGFTLSSAHEASTAPSTDCTITASNYDSYYGYGDDRDGYIKKGWITLKRVGGGGSDSFELYVKGATRYVKYGGRYYKIDGVQTVTINNIKYKTH